MSVAIASQPEFSGPVSSFLKRAPRLLIGGEWVESMSGTTRRVHLVRHEACPSCHGAGEVAVDPVHRPLAKIYF